ncbi:ubiquitin-conjugating enzyme E2 R2-like [Grus japonensis]|uniref:Ubiquitin-conjugating enzyme E2 R2-like n=1 Tax=Grus japonensis TaxID=30415 RepID=A0ABC9YHB5_GRUJA
MAQQQMSSSQKALMLELKSLQEEPVEGFRITLVDESDLYNWEVAIFGPPNTLYEGGYFKPMEDDGEQRFHLQPLEDPRQEQVETHLKEAVTPWEAHAGAGSWQDLWREEPMLEQVCWQDL